MKKVGFQFYQVFRIVFYFYYLTLFYFIFMAPVENHFVKWAIYLKNYKNWYFIIISIMIIKYILLLSILMSTE